MRYFLENQDKFKEFAKVIRKNDIDSTGFIDADHFVDLLAIRMSQFDTNPQLKNELKENLLRAFPSNTDKRLFNCKLLFTEYFPTNSAIEAIQQVNQKILETKKNSAHDN